MPDVPKLWPGQTIVCVASGPSLTAEDCALVRGRARVITVNDAHRLAPFADGLYGSDHRWWKHYQGCPDFQGLKFSVLAKYRARAIWQHPGLVYLDNAGERGLTTDASALCTGHNSGHAAVNLAVHLGAARIVLLGYDMYRTGGRAHFFGEHPQKLQQADAFEMFRKLFATLVDPLRALNIEIVNCSRQTALRCVPKARLEDLFPAREEAAA